MKPVYLKSGFADKAECPQIVEHAGGQHLPGDAHLDSGGETRLIGPPNAGRDRPCASRRGIGRFVMQHGRYRLIDFAARGEKLERPAARRVQQPKSQSDGVPIDPRPAR